MAWRLRQSFLRKARHLAETGPCRLRMLRRQATLPSSCCRPFAGPSPLHAQAASNAALRAAYTTLVADGDTHLYYVETASLFGPAATEVCSSLAPNSVYRGQLDERAIHLASCFRLQDSGTANGLHSTDAGMHDVGAFWISFLPTLLRR